MFKINIRCHYGQFNGKNYCVINASITAMLFNGAPKDYEFKIINQLVSIN